MTAVLSVLAPNTITDAMLTSSTVPENDYAAYSAATTYAIGDRCISTVTHRIYESLKASNINHDPTNILNQAAGTGWWNDIAPTNKWAAFDGIVSTPTIGATPMTMVLAPGAFNGLYVGGIDAADIAITIKDASGGNVVFSYSGILEGSMPDDYFEYFYDPFKPQTDYFLNNLDAYANCQITVTLNNGASNCKAGIIALGDNRKLGFTQKGPKAKPKTYSYIKVDGFGENTIVRRKASTDMSATAILEIADANSVVTTLQSVLDVPCVFACSAGAQFSALRVFGLGSGEISYDNPYFCQISLNVQGLI